MANEWKKFSAEDRRWLRKNQPLINFHDKGTLLRGTVRFIDAETYVCNQIIKLSGCYEIEVKVSANGTPSVWEIGGYIESLRSKHKKLHVWAEKQNNNNGYLLCLSTPLTIQKAIPIKTEDLFQKFIIRYFLFYACFEKHGKKPWGDLNHDVGLLQDYVNHEDMGAISYMEKVFDLGGLWQCCRPFSMILRQENCPDDASCLCHDNKPSCDCGGIEGFRLLQKNFNAEYESVSGENHKKLHPNGKCLCRKTKAKKCVYVKEHNLDRERANYFCLREKIKNLKRMVLEKEKNNANVVQTAKQLM